MSSSREGLAIVDEKLTYTNVVEEIDIESVLSEYVMAEDLEAILPSERIPTVVTKSYEGEVAKDDEEQVPLSPIGSDLSVRAEELSESILENLPVSPSLRDVDQDPEQVNCEDIDSAASSDRINQKVPEGAAPDLGVDTSKSDVKPSTSVMSRLVSLFRLTVLALLVFYGLKTSARWSLPYRDASTKEEARTMNEGELNGQVVMSTLVVDKTPKYDDWSQDYMEQWMGIDDRNNALSILPTVDDSKRGWGTFFAQLLGLTLSVCSVTMMKDENTGDEKLVDELVHKNLSNSRLDSICHLLVDCKKSLRRNGRRSRKESDLKGYDTAKYERLSVEDLQKILTSFNQSTKGSKQCLIKAIVTEYARQLALLTKAEIKELEEFHDIRSDTVQTKAKMIKTLVEAAF
ncbi:hypothetical protein FisN_5Hh222 [Fistulifera solaris]|jgi:hypothetical protein|uniref:SAP domain-containing protein n=1 Tax=Fistulifera solaris TaxID=1519565 RepID=A0A1Z5JSC6_FISSO|nr:hypothetical protein FisN_5Hh222 [Fistulifera solaris]|eukprot:GAX16849.1 hypothetical protein FisN_5Hh222 [Fistulifera solaris]